MSATKKSLMTRIFQIIFITLFMPCALRAMDDLIFGADVQARNQADNDDAPALRSLEEGGGGQIPASATTTEAQNPVFTRLRFNPDVPPKPPQKPRVGAMQRLIQGSKRINRDRLPAPLFTDDNDDDFDYIPLEEKKPVQKAPKKPIINAIIAHMEKETFRKFMYDMENMKMLDTDAYGKTIAYLMQCQNDNVNFIFVSKMHNGTPDIIRSIEEKTKYRFPNNIVVRDKTLNPYACSLSEVACCTAARITEQRKVTIENMTDNAQGDIKEVERETPTVSYFIQKAINEYLDLVLDLLMESPEARKERLYKNAIRGPIPTKTAEIAKFDQKG